MSKTQALVLALIGSFLEAKLLSQDCANISGPWQVSEQGSLICNFGGDVEEDEFGGTGAVTIIQTNCDAQYTVPGTSEVRTGTVSGNDVHFSGRLLLPSPDITFDQNVLNANGTLLENTIIMTSTGFASGIIGGTLPFTCSAESTAIFSRDLIPMRIVDLSLQHREVPSGAWIEMPKENTLPLTTDGNMIRTEVTIENPEDFSQAAALSFRLNGELLPDGEQNLLFDANQETTVRLDWDSTGLAWNGTFPITIHEIAVSLQNQSTDEQAFENLQIAPRPVILVHGLASNFGAWSAYDQFLESAHVLWNGRAFAVGDGRARGVLDTGSLDKPLRRFASIEENAITLARYIDDVRTLLDSWHVDIVAHSLGGLISRKYIQDYMIASIDQNPVVRQLVMLGTPNVGSFCVEPFITLNPSLYQLHPLYLTLYFNLSVLDRRNVHFSILAGTPFLYTCGVFERGDGVVSQSSALWIIGDYEHSDSIHTELNRSPIDFGFVLRRLSADVGFQAQRDVDLVSPRDSGSRLTIKRAIVEIGVAPQLIQVQVPNAEALTVTASGSPEVSGVLMDPSGNVVDHLADTPEPYRSLRIDSPVSGRWSLVLDHDLAETATVLVAAEVTGSETSINIEQLDIASDESVDILVRAVVGARPLTGAVAQVMFSNTEGETTLKPLVDDGLMDDGTASNGVYGANVQLPGPGIYIVTVEVTFNEAEWTTTSILQLGEEGPACAGSDSHLCLNNKRFRVEVQWRDFQGNPGQGQVAPVDSSDSGIFWFFSSDNWEMLVKVLDGCGINDHFWVFAAATTDVEYTLTVTDTVTGESKSYFNPLGTASASITDTAAFAVCESSTASATPGTWTRIIEPPRDATYGSDKQDPCTTGANSLCLNRSRFKVEVDWRTSAGGEGTGQVVPFGSDDSGLFYFFSADNWEMLIKVLDGCGINNRFWVFFAATTDVEFTVTVTDTEMNQVKQYFNPLGNPANAVTDTSAFATCP